VRRLDGKEAGIGAASRHCRSVRPGIHPTCLAVPAALLEVDDGDTILIRWSDKDVERVRILGIDAPETRHVEHNLPHAQPFLTNPPGSLMTPQP
jgi:endonuclease YncB( thermonuclease family)